MDWIIFFFSVLVQPVSTIFECFPIVFSLPCPWIQSHLKHFFLSNIFLKNPCDVLSAQPSSTIDTLLIAGCVLPPSFSLVLIFVICFIWGIVFFSPLFAFLWEYFFFFSTLFSLSLLIHFRFFPEAFVFCNLSSALEFDWPDSTKGRGGQVNRSAR